VFPGLDLAETTERLALITAALADASEHGSVTVGLAQLREDDSPEDLVARADAALYRERRRGVPPRLSRVIDAPRARTGDDRRPSDTCPNVGLRPDVRPTETTRGALSLRGDGGWHAYTPVTAVDAARVACVQGTMLGDQRDEYLSGPKVPVPQPTR